MPDFMQQLPSPLNKKPLARQHGMLTAATSARAYALPSERSVDPDSFRGPYLQRLDRERGFLRAGGNRHLEGIVI